MSLDSDLKALARRAYLSYHLDGVIDLLIGWMAFALGLRLSFDAPAIALLAWLPLLSYVPIKNDLTVPRVGYVQFGAEYGQRGRRRQGSILAGLLGFLVLAIALLVLLAPNVIATLVDKSVAVYGGVVTVLLLLAGLLSGILRLAAYGLVCAVLAFACGLAGLPDFLLFILLGLVIMLVGAILLVRFMHKYPPAQEGMNHGAA